MANSKINKTFSRFLIGMRSISLRRIALVSGALFFCSTAQASVEKASLSVSAFVPDSCRMSDTVPVSGAAATIVGRRRLNVRCNGQISFAISSGPGELFHGAIEGAAGSRPTIITISY